MDMQGLLVNMQHTPLPETMASFERTVSPKEPQELADGAWLVVEYRHFTADVRFQVVLRESEALFQTVTDGQTEIVRTGGAEEAGNILRSDLLMMLEELEDEL